MAEPGMEIISGTIGMGKSFHVLWKIIESLRQDKPCCYIDPKGDTYRNLLAYFCTPEGQELWNARRHRIRLLNSIAKSGYILGFNTIRGLPPPQGQTIDPTAYIANAITAHIKKQSGYGSFDAMRMDEIMSASIGLLVSEGLSLNEMPLLFVPPPKRKGVDGKMVAAPLNGMVKHLLSRIDHFPTRNFWEMDYANWSTPAKQDWPQSAKNKVFQYTFNERVNYTLNTEGGLDFEELVGERMWLFVNIPYQFISDTLTSLVGNLIITKIFHACMRRYSSYADDYRLILDEARFFNTGPLDQILETARAYHLWLTLVVQSLNQLCRNSQGGIDHHLKDTALNNVRYFSIFGNNDYEDSLTYSRMIFPVTGTQVINQTPTGTTQYLPISAEEEQYRQKFVTLPKQKVVLYDKLRRASVKTSTVPIALPPVDESKLDMLEAEHLMLTGISTAEAKSEVETRYNYWKAMLVPPTVTTPKGGMGGAL